MRRPWMRAGLVGPLLLGALHAQQGSEVLPGDPFEHLSESLQRSLATLDPRVDGWSSEARSDAAAAQLKKIAAYLETGSEAEVLAGVFSEGFVGGPFTPLEESFADAVFRVRLAGRAAGQATDRAGFLERLRAAVAGAHAIHAKFKSLRVDEDEDGLVTQAWLILSAEGREVALQDSSWWECHWLEDGQGELPRLHRVRFLDHQEVEARAAGPSSSPTVRSRCSLRPPPGRSSSCLA